MRLKNIFIKKIFIVTAIFLFVTTMGCTANSALKVTDLKCENLTDPLGINTSRPHFSWINSSSEQGATQTAYQILVASEIEKLDENNSNYWNSGKTSSSESVLVEYSGKKLSSGEQLYWKIRVWDGNDMVSDWSRPAKFSIGLLNSFDWFASYIRLNSEVESSDTVSSPQFRKQFSIDKIGKNEAYFLHVNSLGYHEVFINGKRVGDEVLSPAVAQFNKRSLINTYDVSEYIKKGENNIIIWLGSGWYNEGLPGVVGKGPVFKAQLEKLDGEDVHRILVSDETWTARESEYKSIGTWRPHRFGGETITGNKEVRNIAFESPDKLLWQSVTITDIPDHEVSPQMVEPNRIKNSISPISTKRIDESSHLIDMGTTISGWFDITFKELEKDQEIVMEYSDHLTADGDIYGQGQIDRYIASGEGTEHFINKFNYHGFRYVKISNLIQEPEINNIKAHFIHTDFEEASSFVSSDHDLNNIHDMISYTLRNVGLGGYLVDCPQIERLGYGGDGNASTITAQTMFNLSPLYNNWLQAWGDVIREDGSMPHTAPNPYSAGGGPYWCGFIISASWNSYQQYGDTRVLEKYYPVMIKWLGYVDNHTIDGLLKRWPDTNYRSWYLGDWATPEGVGNPNHSDERSVDLVNNCYISICLGQMEKIADILGKESDKLIFAEKRSVLNKLIHDTYFDVEEGYYSTGSQIDIIFPMLAEVTPKEMHNDLTQLLIEKTDSEYGGHLNTGLVGIPVMMEWAAKANQPDFIYSMLKKRSYPSYLYMIDNGATTTWEHWNGERSRIHNCYNGVGQWFYQVVGGIRNIEGERAFKRFIIDPQIPSGISWAKTSQMTPYGNIKVDWEIKGDKLLMDIEIPVGTTGILNVPGSETNESETELMSGKHLLELDYK